ncbi:hypothetical protein X777_12585, partial [Ooceraea biroi]
KEEKEGKRPMAEGAADRRKREPGKRAIKSKALSQRASRHFAVACLAREMMSAKMADRRGGSSSSLPSVHALRLTCTATLGR